MTHRVIRLADIPLRDLIPVKITIKWIEGEDHSRWVLRESEHGQFGGLFFKIWNPTYVRRDNVLRAIEAGFYDNYLTPALEALVFHRDVCRGYVMKCGVPNRRLSTKFFELVKTRTHEAGYFHVQFSAAHTIMCDKKLSLLDLEAVYPIAQYANHQRQFDCVEYEQYVANLYEGAMTGPKPPGCISETESKDMNGARGPGRLRSFLRKIEGVAEHGRRRVLIGVRNLHPRTDMIDI